ncbi:MAG: nickel-dependent hydrogenase large subunit [Kofleriaceae bacterium]|nr:MAG: nickel-dependent hydrogenase large subunit [Kofleriaceae bacterium]MBZ0236682.1 nickel-dependent hydrogenase large subunit [Kofleriaceae bacterium]
MTHIVVDPVTRIEGHLRIEAEVEGGRVASAWSSSTMFRGIELILQGRDPRDAWAFTQRICGVCTTVHAIASVRAVEDAIGAKPPTNARIARNLMMAAQCIQDHVVHFYHLHALDWVDVVSALQADPTATASLAQSISDWPESSASYFRATQERLRAFVERGQLGPFGNAYWGHPAYRLPAEANLLAVAHYLAALEWQRDFIKVHALLGGKNPHPQGFLVGGMATPVDPSSQASINIHTIAALKDLVKGAREFVSKVYIPDLLAIAGFYKDWAGHGAGVGNYLVYGEYPMTDQKGAPLYIPSGVIRNRDLAIIEPFDPRKITEQVAHSWYRYDGGDKAALHPSKGETHPTYTGPKPPYDRLDTSAKYSWLKSPRYDGLPMEVGPLARMLVSYASGHPEVKGLVDFALGKLGVGPEALFSTLGRVAARGLETKLLVDKIGDWIDELALNMGKGDLRIHDTSKWDPSSWPREASGAGFHEAPRGALGHWVHISNGKISRYQCVVPSTWNAGPRDASGLPGPYESALVGTPVHDPEQPLEILRTVHSFDPCMACGVHVVDPKGRELARVKVR